MIDPRSSVTAIVSAYNEEPTIGAVVKTLVDSGLFRDVIVISDGSTDRTWQVAKDAGASLVHQFPWKHGKGAAMQHGVAHTDTPLIFFCDADLIGLTVEHLRSVIEPVRNGQAVMCVGLRDRGRFLVRLSQYLPLIGGERCLRREVFESVPDAYLQGYMVETAMNEYCRVHGLPVTTRPLWGLHIRRKMQKVGFVRGLKEYASMGMQMQKAKWIIRVARWQKKF